MLATEYETQHSGGIMNWQVFFIVWVAAPLAAGIIWLIMKYFAKAGKAVIPLLCAVAAGILAPSKGGFANQIVALAVAVAFVGIGVAGSLACYLHSDLFDLEKGMKRVKKKVQSSTSSENLVP